VQLSNRQTRGLRGDPEKNALLPKLAFGDAPTRHRTPREILSNPRKFLQPFSGSAVDDYEEISNASAIGEGERCMKDTVHHFALFPFTLAPEEVKEKESSARERPQCLAAEPKLCGLERPHHLCTRRAQLLRGVAPAHTFASRAGFWNQT